MNGNSNASQLKIAIFYTKQNNITIESQNAYTRKRLIYADKLVKIIPKVCIVLLRKIDLLLLISPTYCHGIIELTRAFPFFKSD